MKIIPTWRSAWRYLSVQAAVLLALLSVLQAEVLPLFQFAIPAERWPWVTAGFGTAIVLLRLLAQSRLDDQASPDAAQQTITVTVPAGMDPAAFAEALERSKARLKGEAP